MTLLFFFHIMGQLQQCAFILSDCSHWIFYHMTTENSCRYVQAFKPKRTFFNVRLQSMYVLSPPDFSSSTSPAVTLHPRMICVQTAQGGNHCCLCMVFKPSGSTTCKTTMEQCMIPHEHFLVYWRCWVVNLLILLSTV